MLMSLPAQVEGLFQQMVDDLCTKQGKMSKRGRTVQFVALEPKFIQVDELAEFRGN